MVFDDPNDMESLIVPTESNEVTVSNPLLGTKSMLWMWLLGFGGLFAMMSPFRKWRDKLRGTSPQEEENQDQENSDISGTNGEPTDGAFQSNGLIAAINPANYFEFKVWTSWPVSVVLAAAVLFAFMAVNSFLIVGEFNIQRMLNSPNFVLFVRNELLLASATFMALETYNAWRYRKPAVQENSEAIAPPVVRNTKMQLATQKTPVNTEERTVPGYVIKRDDGVSRIYYNLGNMTRLIRLRYRDGHVTRMTTTHIQVSGKKNLEASGQTQTQSFHYEYEGNRLMRIIDRNRSLKGQFNSIDQLGRPTKLTLLNKKAKSARSPRSNMSVRNAPIFPFISE